MLWNLEDGTKHEKLRFNAGRRPWVFKIFKYSTHGRMFFSKEIWRIIHIHSEKQNQHYILRIFGLVVQRLALNNTALMSSYFYGYLLRVHLFNPAKLCVMQLRIFLEEEQTRNLSAPSWIGGAEVDWDRCSDCTKKPTSQRAIDWNI